MYREKTEESFLPEKEAKLVLYLKDSPSFSSQESAVILRSSQGSVSPQGVAVDKYTQCSEGRGPGCLLYDVSCHGQHHPRRQRYHPTLQKRKQRLSKLQRRSDTRR